MVSLGYRLRSPSRRPAYHTRAPVCGAGKRPALVRRVSGGRRSNRSWHEHSFVVPVIYGSVRTARQASGRPLRRDASSRSEMSEAVLVDPMEKPLPLLDRMYKEFPKGQAPPVMEELSELFLCRRFRHRFRRVQSRHSACAEKSARPLSRRIFLASGGDSSAIPAAAGAASRGDAVAHVAGRDGNGDDAVALCRCLRRSNLRYDGTPKDPGTDRIFGRVFRRVLLVHGSLRERRKTGVPY